MTNKPPLVSERKSTRMNRNFFLKFAAASICFGLLLGCESGDVAAPSQEMLDSLPEADPNAKEPVRESPPSIVDPGKPPRR